MTVLCRIQKLFLLYNKHIAIYYAYIQAQIRMRASVAGTYGTSWRAPSCMPGIHVYACVYTVYYFILYHLEFL